MTLSRLGAASLALAACAAFAPPGGQSRTVSPDGRWVAVVDNPRDDADTESGPESVLSVRPSAGGRGRVLLRGGPPRDDPKRTLHTFAEPTWSLDGGFVYVLAGAYATSGVVHQVDVATGAERYVIDGNSVKVLRDGAYRGMLLVTRHKYRRNGDGAYDPTDVVRPDGKVVLTVPGSAADDSAASVSRWLKVHGWRAN